MVNILSVVFFQEICGDDRSCARVRGYRSQKLKRKVKHKLKVKLLIVNFEGSEAMGLIGVKDHHHS